MRPGGPAAESPEKMKMAIEVPTVRHIADLACLEFSEEEIQVLSRQLHDVLVYIGKLSELDIRAIEPTCHGTEVSHAFREDRVVPSIPASEALANAPESREGLFTVPRVLG